VEEECKEPKYSLVKNYAERLKTHHKEDGLMCLAKLQESS
jgi:hypothetical protein